MIHKQSDLIEKLAEYAHDAWSGWMRYMFEKCEKIEIPRFHEFTVIPEWAVERWTRQMNTSYKDLPEEEKKSDREEAMKIFEVITKED